MRKAINKRKTRPSKKVSKHNVLGIEMTNTLDEVKGDKVYEDYVASKTREASELATLEDSMNYQLSSAERFASDEGEFDSFYEDQSDILEGYLPPVKKIVDNTASEQPDSDLERIKAYKAKVYDTSIFNENLANSKQKYQGEKSLEALKSVADKLAQEIPVPKHVSSGISISNNAGFPPINDSLANYTKTIHRKDRDILKKRTYANASYLEPSFSVDNTRVDVLPEVDSDKVKNPADIDMFEKIRDAFKIIRTSERTIVYAVARDKDETKNVLCKIRCYGGIAFGGYARDSSTDSFVLDCIEYLHLGTVPFGFRLEMPKTGSWNVEVPIPEKVLEQVLIPTQRKALNDLREKYSDKNYEIFFLQMVLAN